MSHDLSSDKYEEFSFQIAVLLGYEELSLALLIFKVEFQEVLERQSTMNELGCVCEDDWLAEILILACKAELFLDLGEINDNFRVSRVVYDFLWFD